MSAVPQRTANPFAHLLGTQIGRLPKVAAVEVVVNGRRITDVRQLNQQAALADDEVDLAVDEQAETARLKRELQRAKDRARYQRDRQDPAKMAARQAYYEANKAKVKAYKKAYDKKHRAAIRVQKKEHARRAYQADPEKHRQASRDSYARNRDAVLARAQAKRDAAKAAKGTV